MIGHNSKMTKEERISKTLIETNMKVSDLIDGLGTMITNHLKNYSDPMQYGERNADPMLERVLLQITNGMKASGWGREDALQMFEDKLNEVYGRVDTFGNPESESA